MKAGIIVSPESTPPGAGISQGYNLTPAGGCARLMVVSPYAGCAFAGSLQEESHRAPDSFVCCTCQVDEARHTHHRKN